jgi:hypothetical protein
MVFWKTDDGSHEKRLELMQHSVESLLVMAQNALSRLSEAMVNMDNVEPRTRKYLHGVIAQASENVMKITQTGESMITALKKEEFMTERMQQQLAELQALTKQMADQIKDKPQYVENQGPFGKMLQLEETLSKEAG